MPAAPRSDAVTASLVPLFWSARSLARHLINPHITAIIIGLGPAAPSPSPSPLPPLLCLLASPPQWSAMNWRSAQSKLLRAGPLHRANGGHVSLSPARLHSTTQGGALAFPEFNDATLGLFRERLSLSLRQAPKVRWKYDESRGPLRKASVLVPFCTRSGEPSVLFTVRSKNLKKHRGEVSFPGGIQDETDPSLESTVLRETFEEVGIQPSSISILGRLTPLPDRTTTIEVTPYVGFLGEIDPRELDYNHDEVSEVFTMGMEEVLDARRRKVVEFRGSPGIRGIEWIKDDKRIWGLSAYILHQTLNVLLDTKL
ncbi:NUDIX hydrolase domain-like protein [Polychytrium aggregatum]|uniref:NUDIX hydrolase domain-like protein n=1 Tax=Polychytrium aggregatum TaxID=110093 RepID=UPI0022FE9E9D|nr:NUDIX hydrolase domain-like protein [Polychytrium aggregatum]KAI9207288.1 NUDIX hydrolase domain-like protein [Polychytrium aggregatum]